MSMKTLDKLISDTRKIAKENDIQVKFSSSSIIYAKDDPNGCTGYFDEDEMILCVSNRNNKHIFISNLVHESSHMDQFLHDRYLWDKCNPGYTIFFEWLDGATDLKQDVLEEAVQDIIRIELDAERRSIRKIRHYNLDSLIDIDEYIRGVNAYLYGYLFALETRHWTPQIYFDGDIKNASSSRLKRSYTKIPRRLHRIFLEKFRQS